MNQFVNIMRFFEPATPTLKVALRYCFALQNDLTITNGKTLLSVTNAFKGLRRPQTPGNPQKK